MARFCLSPREIYSSQIVGYWPVKDDWALFKRNYPDLVYAMDRAICDGSEKRGTAPALYAYSALAGLAYNQKTSPRRRRTSFLFRNDQGSVLVLHTPPIRR